MEDKIAVFDIERHIQRKRLLVRVTGRSEKKGVRKISLEGGGGRNRDSIVFKTCFSDVEVFRRLLACC